MMKILDIKKYYTTGNSNRMVMASAPVTPIKVSVGLDGNEWSKN
jgi:hypothetical protein